MSVYFMTMKLNSPSFAYLDWNKYNNINILIIIFEIFKSDKRLKVEISPAFPVFYFLYYLYKMIIIKQLYQHHKNCIQNWVFKL